MMKYLTPEQRQLCITILTIAVVAALLLVASGCAKGQEPFKDAERNDTNNEPADTITFPDGFSNVATKCDHGNRVYVIFKQDSAYGSIAVVPNAEGC
jgi:hypothetical protein